MRFQVIPSTLAENAGLNPIATVTDLRNKHALGFASAGINVRKGSISNMMEEGVSQPLLVTISAITLATETVRSILKIDDIVSLSPQEPFKVQGNEEAREDCSSSKIAEVDLTRTIQSTRE